MELLAAAVMLQSLLTSLVAAPRCLVDGAAASVVAAALMYHRRC